MRKVLAVLILLVAFPAQAGERTQDIQWSALKNLLAQHATAVRIAIVNAEEIYNVLLLARNGESDADWCKRLYAKDPCTADEIASVTDAVETGSALHAIYQSANNQAVSARDRFADLRQFID